MTCSDTVAVVGCGPLGLVMAILAKHAGAASVFITGLKQDQKRLALCKEVGAYPIMVDQMDPQQLICDLSAAGVIQSINIARKGGRISILGQGHEAVQFQTAILSFRELELVGTRAYTAKDWEKVCSTLLNTADDLSRVVTHRMPLAKAAEGIKLMKSRAAMKIILET